MSPSRRSQPSLYASYARIKLKPRRAAAFEPVASSKLDSLRSRAPFQASPPTQRASLGSRASVRARSRVGDCAAGGRPRAAAETDAHTHTRTLKAPAVVVRGRDVFERALAHLTARCGVLLHLRERRGAAVVAAVNASNADGSLSLPRFVGSDGGGGARSALFAGQLRNGTSMSTRTNARREELRAVGSLAERKLEDLDAMNDFLESLGHSRQPSKTAARKELKKLYINIHDFANDIHRLFPSLRKLRADIKLPGRRFPRKYAKDLGFGVLLHHIFA